MNKAILTYLLEGVSYWFVYWLLQTSCMSVIGESTALYVNWEKKKLNQLFEKTTSYIV